METTPRNPVKIITWHKFTWKYHHNWIFNWHSMFGTKYAAEVHTVAHSNRIENPHHFSANSRWFGRCAIALACLTLHPASNPASFCWFEHFQSSKNTASTVKIPRFPHLGNWSRIKCKYSITFTLVNAQKSIDLIIFHNNWFYFFN